MQQGKESSLMVINDYHILGLDQKRNLFYELVENVSLRSTFPRPAYLWSHNTVARSTARITCGRK